MATEPMGDSRIDPPINGNEADTLLAFLDYHRDTLRWKVSGLDMEALNSRVVPTTTITLAGLMRHLTYVEDNWLTRVFAGQPMPQPWASAPWDEDPDWEWTTASSFSPGMLRAEFDAAVARSDAITRAAVAAGGLDGLSASPHRESGRPVSLRWIITHLIEEYARHNGHADLLREAIDGMVGE